MITEHKIRLCRLSFLSRSMGGRFFVCRGVVKVLLSDFWLGENYNYLCFCAYVLLTKCEK